MIEQRRHQRIRFGTPPAVKIGYGGTVSEGGIENLSLSGLMFRVPMSLDIGQLAGCEFSVFDSPVIDVPITVVSRIGADVFGARFQAGPINQVQIEDAINGALGRGQASVLSVHDLGGRKVMRVLGGLNGTLRNDFMHALTCVRVEEIDLEGVSVADQAGIALCLIAVGQHSVKLGAQSKYFAQAWKKAIAVPGALENAGTWT